MESSAQEAPIPRRAHTKSKSGCRTCKSRKVKCDESRPLCKNCERHFANLVTCDFDGQERTTRPTASSSSSRQAPSRSSRAVAVSRLPIRPNEDAGRQGEPLLQLPTAVSGGRLDPFEMRPVSAAPAPTVDDLITHYLSSFAYRTFPFYANRPLIELWWPFVREDEVLFHVVLLLSQADRESLSQQVSDHSNQLLTDCISMLNRRVQDPVLSTSDHTVAAVALMAALEHDGGNFRALNMHLDGLKQVVGIRGGLGTLRFQNPMAANLVFWISMLSVHEPELLTLTYGDLDNPVDWLHGRDAADPFAEPFSPLRLEDFGVDLLTAKVLYEVQRLSRLYTATVDYGTPQEATNVLSHLCSIIERLLLMSQTTINDSNIPGLSRSCRLAGCLHVLNPLSGYSFPSPTLMLHSLVRDLKTNLTILIRAIGTNSVLLLWLLAVGGITAHSMPERGWFVGHLVVTVTDMGISSWEEMKVQLEMLALHDNFCDQSFARLWEEIRRKQETLNLTPAAQVTGWCGERLVQGAAAAQA